MYRLTNKKLIDLVASSWTVSCIITVFASLRFVYHTQASLTCWPSSMERADKSHARPRLCYRFSSGSACLAVHPQGSTARLCALVPTHMRLFAVWGLDV